MRECEDRSAQNVPRLFLRETLKFLGKAEERGCIHIVESRVALAAEAKRGGGG